MHYNRAETITVSKLKYDLLEAELDDYRSKEKYYKSVGESFGITIGVLVMGAVLVLINFIYTKLTSEQFHIRQWIYNYGVASFIFLIVALLNLEKTPKQLKTGYRNDV